MPPPRRRRSPRTVAFAESRIRKETIAAEDILHDLGALSMMSSDSQAMGRVGEVIIRTWQTAHKMKGQRGALPGETARQRQFPRQALHREIHDQPGHRAGHRARRSARSRSGKLADLVLWSPAFFGVKPDLVIKGGAIAWAAMGDPNASIPTPQPVHYRPMFGAFGRRADRQLRHLRFGAPRWRRGSARARPSTPLVAVRNTRGGIGKRR